MKQIQNDNFEINQKIHNFNNKSSSNFYRIDKNINNNLNQRKIPNTPHSENFSGKKIILDKSKKKINKVNKIKTLSYSNSTRDIYSNKKNYQSINNNYNSNNQYNKKRINQIPINNYNLNNKKQKSSSNNIFTPPKSKGISSNTNININNFYLNNIFSSIYNIYMTNNNRINFYSKQNNGIIRKFISQRSSSVIASKKPSSKINLLERKNILKKQIGNNHKINKNKK